MFLTFSIFLLIVTGLLMLMFFEASILFTTLVFLLWVTGLLTVMFFVASML